MSIRKLFGLGKPDHQTENVVLKSNMAALLGAAEGESIEVTASKEGLASLEQAERNLQAIADEQQQTADSLKVANEQNKAHEARIEALQATIAEKDQQIEELGNAPATNHTGPKSGDAYTGDQVRKKPLAAHQEAALAEIEKARAKANANSI